MMQTSERTSKRELIEAYLRQQGTKAKASVSPIPRETNTSPAPLSFGQNLIWTHSQLEPEVPLYNEPWTVHFNGELNVVALERAINEFVLRHEAWRTAFPMQGEGPVQVVHPSLRVPFQQTDLRGLQPSEKEREAVRLAEIDARKAFDLQEGPLLRVHVITFDDHTHRIYLTLHHILFDGFAIYRVFLPEVAQIYDALCKDEPLPHFALPIQYSQFARWQNERWTEERSQTALTKWGDELRGKPTVLNLKSTYPRPSVQSYAGAMCPVAIGGELRDRLRGLGAQQGASLFMVLLAAFEIELFRMSGQAEFLIGTVTAGRNHPELASLVGYCLNTVVLSADLRGEPTFRSLLQRVRDNTLSVLANDEVPFHRLLGKLDVPRDSSMNPLYQVMFSLEPPIAAPDPRWNITQIEVETGVSKLDLYFELDDRRDGVTGKLTYKTSLFSRDAARTIVSDYILLLESIVSQPDLPLSQFCLSEFAPAASAGSLAMNSDRFDERADAQLTKKVVAIWSSILGRTVEPDDNFFLSGGHSLMAVRLLAEVERILEIRMSYSELAQAPTPQRFSKILHQKFLVAKR